MIRILADMKFQIKIDRHKAIDSACANLVGKRFVTDKEYDEFCEALHNFFPQEQIVLEFDSETQTATVVK